MTLTELKPCFVLIIYLGYVHTFDIQNLYKQYKEAPGDGPRYLVLRRTFRQNATEYQVHIKRLREVNALKQHNLMRSNDSLIKVNETVYITNPVEAKLPQAFLTFHQFKQTLLENVLKDRDGLRKQKLQAVIQKLWENRKKRKLTIKLRRVKTSNITKVIKVNSKNQKHKKSPKLTTKIGKKHAGKAQNVDNKTKLVIKMNNSDINAEKYQIKISEGTPAVQELDSAADSKIIIVPLEPVAVEKAKDTTESKETIAKGQTRHDNSTSNQHKLGNTVANKTKVTLVSIAEKIVLKASDEATTAPSDPSDETTSTPNDQNTANNESVIESTDFGGLELTEDMKTTTESVSHYLGVVIDAKDGLNATESSETGDREETTTPTIETDDREETTIPTIETDDREETTIPTIETDDREETTIPTIETDDRDETTTPTIETDDREETTIPTIETDDREETTIPTIETDDRDETTIPTIETDDREETTTPTIETDDREETTIPTIETDDREETTIPTIETDDRDETTIPTIETDDREETTIPTIETDDREETTIPTIETDDRDETTTPTIETDDRDETTTPTIETATTAEDKSYEYVAEEETEEPTTSTTEKITLGRPRVFMGR